MNNSFSFFFLVCRHVHVLWSWLASMWRLGYYRRRHYKELCQPCCAFKRTLGQGLESKPLKLMLTDCDFEWAFPNTCTCIKGMLLYIYVSGRGMKKSWKWRSSSEFNWRTVIGGYYPHLFRSIGCWALSAQGSMSNLGRSMVCWAHKARRSLHEEDLPRKRLPLNRTSISWTSTNLPFWNDVPGMLNLQTISTKLL